MTLSRRQGIISAPESAHAVVHAMMHTSDTGLPGRIVPNKGQLHDGARFRDLHGSAQRAIDYRRLVFTVEGFAGRMPEGIIHEEAPGRLYERGEVVG